MPVHTPRASTFALIPHPTTPAPWLRGITGTITPVPGGLMVTFVVIGAIDRVLVPVAREPRFADELWRHTCFELFVSRRDAPGYREFNFSPSGEWAVYEFARYRERVRSETNPELNPHVTLCRSDDRLELDAVVQFVDTGDAKLELGVSAVIEDAAGELSYWALAHPLDRPDFHHRDAFALELDEVRH